MQKITLPKNETCPAHQPDALLPDSVDILASDIARLGDVQVVDIRTHQEVAADPLLCAHIHIPMDQLLAQPQLFSKDATSLLVCAAGVRTQYTANALRSVGYTHVYSLIGGNRMLANR